MAFHWKSAAGTCFGHDNPKVLRRELAQPSPSPSPLPSPSPSHFLHLALVEVEIERGQHVGTSALWDACFDGDGGDEKGGKLKTLNVHILCMGNADLANSRDSICMSCAQETLSMCTEHTHKKPKSHTEPSDSRKSTCKLSFKQWEPHPNAKIHAHSSGRRAAGVVQIEHLP